MKIKIREKTNAYLSIDRIKYFYRKLEGVKGWNMGVEEREDKIIVYEKDENGLVKVDSKILILEIEKGVVKNVEEINRKNKKKNEIYLMFVEKEINER